MHFLAIEKLLGYPDQLRFYGHFQNKSPNGKELASEFIEIVWPTFFLGLNYYQLGESVACILPQTDF